MKDILPKEIVHVCAGDVINLDLQLQFSKDKDIDMDLLRQIITGFLSKFFDCDVHSSY